jgi:hypothetical protein
MPPLALAAAVVGSAAIGAVASNSAASKAAKASQHATDQSLALQKAQYDQTRADEQPFVQAGYGGLNALQARLGVSAPTAAATSQNGVIGSSTSGSTAAPGAPAGSAAYNYGGATADDFGGGRPGTLSAGEGTPMGADTAGGKLASSAANSQNAAPTVTSTATPPTNTSAAAPTTGVDPGTYGNGATGVNPTYTASTYQAPSAYQAPDAFQAAAYKDPGNFSYSLDDYKASPAYAWQLDQAQKGVLASSAATGALQSGAALKELSDRSQAVALNDYNNERSFAADQFAQNRSYDRANYQDDRNYGQSTYEDARNYGLSAYDDARNFGRSTYDTDRAYNTGVYQDERNYLTGRYDTQTGNLFNLTNVGQSAASQTANAGQNYTNSATGLITNNATTKGNAAIAGANATTSLLGSGVNALAYTNALKTPAATAYSGGASSNPYTDLYT